MSRHRANEIQERLERAANKHQGLELDVDDVELLLGVLAEFQNYDDEIWEP